MPKGKLEEVIAKKILLAVVHKTANFGILNAGKCARATEGSLETRYTKEGEFEASFELNSLTSIDIIHNIEQGKLSFRLGYRDDDAAKAMAAIGILNRIAGIEEGMKSNSVKKGSDRSIVTAGSEMDTEAFLRDEHKFTGFSVTMKYNNLPDLVRAINIMSQDKSLKIAPIEAGAELG